jgi:hypothetical protein
MEARPGAGETTRRQTLHQTASVSLSLENLPFEIQRLTMSHAPILNTLSAATQRLPSFTMSTSGLVVDLAALRCVASGLDGILVDAHAAHLSGTSSFQQIRNEKML